VDLYRVPRHWCENPPVKTGGFSIGLTMMPAGFHQGDIHNPELSHVLFWFHRCSRSSRATAEYAMPKEHSPREFIEPANAVDRALGRLNELIQATQELERWLADEEKKMGNNARPEQTYHRTNRRNRSKPREHRLRRRDVGSFNACDCWKGEWPRTLGDCGDHNGRRRSSPRCLLSIYRTPCLAPPFAQLRQLEALRLKDSFCPAEYSKPLFANR